MENNYKIKLILTVGMSLDLIIVVPAHNEAKRLPAVLVDYNNFFKQQSLKYKIIVVDNNSQDDTYQVINSLSLPEVVVIREMDTGKGRAVKTGFIKALEVGADYIGFVDADGSTAPKEYYRLFKTAKNYDGLIASRLLPGSQVYGRSFFRQLASRSFKLFRNLCIQLPFSDTQCGAKIFKAEALRAVIDNLTIGDMAFDVQLLALLYRQRFLIKEEPTIWVHTGDSATFHSPLALLTTADRMFWSLRKIKKSLK